VEVGDVQGGGAVAVLGRGQACEGLDVALPGPGGAGVDAGSDPGRGVPGAAVVVDDPAGFDAARGVGGLPVAAVSRRSR
jgi:hypothetical protein